MTGAEILLLVMGSALLLHPIVMRVVDNLLQDKREKLIDLATQLARRPDSPVTPDDIGKEVADSMGVRVPLMHAICGPFLLLGSIFRGEDAEEPNENGSDQDAEGLYELLVKYSSSFITCSLLSNPFATVLFITLLVLLLPLYILGMIINRRKPDVVEEVSSLRGGRIAH